MIKPSELMNLRDLSMWSQFIHLSQYKHKQIHLRRCHLIAQYR